MIGTRCGTKLTVTGRAAAAESSCSISAMWRWPVGAYARRFSLTDTKSNPSPVARPAPETPDWASIWNGSLKKDSVTVFTCGGVFNTATHEYSQRLIVRAERA